MDQHKQQNHTHRPDIPPSEDPKVLNHTTKEGGRAAAGAAAAAARDERRKRKEKDREAETERRSIIIDTEAADGVTTAEDQDRGTLKMTLKMREEDTTTRKVRRDRDPKTGVGGMEEEEETTKMN